MAHPFAPSSGLVPWKPRYTAIGLPGWEGLFTKGSCLLFEDGTKKDIVRVVVDRFDVCDGLCLVFGNRLCQVMGSEPEGKVEWVVSSEMESFSVRWVADELVVLPLSKRGERQFWPNFVCFVVLESDNPIFSPSPLLLSFSKRHRILALANSIWDATQKFLLRSNRHKGDNLLNEKPFDEDVLIGWLPLTHRRGSNSRCVVEDDFSPFTSVFGVYFFQSVEKFSEDGWGVVKRDGCKHYLTQMVFDFNPQKKELKMSLCKVVQSSTGSFGDMGI